MLASRRAIPGLSSKLFFISALAFPSGEFVDDRARETGACLVSEAMVDPPQLVAGGGIQGEGATTMITRLWRNRSLLVSMIRRQYQLRYRQSFMGWVWAFVPPLVGTVVGTVVFHRVAGIETGNVPYPLFVMAGLVPWTFFSSSLVLGVPSLVQMTQTISRVPSRALSCP